MAATDAKRRRRIGVLATGLGALAGTVARGETTLEMKTLWYGESGDRTEVVNPALALRHDFGDRGVLGLQLAYDTISGASPTGEVPTLDATASASSAGEIPQAMYSDTRRAADLSYSRRFGSHLPSVDLSYSRENDYSSRGVSLVDSWEVLGGRSTFRFGAGLTRDRIEPVGSSDLFRKRSDSVSVGWTQVLGPRDLLDVSLGLTRYRGYLTDPYKRVTVGDASFPELRPESRDRTAVVFKYGHYFLTRTALKAHYRFYRDDWSVRSHTLELAVDQRVGRRTIVSPRLRYYRQGNADFFAYEFSEPREFMSSDYRLSSLWSWLAGIGYEVQINDGLSFAVEAAFQKQTGLDRVTARAATPALDGRSAAAILDEDEDEGEGEGAPRSLSAADLDTFQFTIGFSYKF